MMKECCVILCMLVSSLLANPFHLPGDACNGLFFCGTDGKQSSESQVTPPAGYTNPGSVLECHRACLLASTCTSLKWKGTACTLYSGDQTGSLSSDPGAVYWGPSQCTPAVTEAHVCG